MNIHDQGFGFSFSSFIDSVAEDPKAALKDITGSIEDSVSAKAQEYLPANVYDKVSDAIHKQGYKIGDQLEQKAGEVITAQAQKYASQPDVQNQAITGSVQAVANKVNAEALKIAESWRNGTFFNDYKMHLAIAGGVAGLFFMRSVLFAAVVNRKKA